MFRPLVSYFVLAAFFTISTLRLTGLTARGLRYRYGEKNSATSFGCGLVFMLAGSTSGSFRLELTEQELGQYSSPSIRHCLRLLVKTTLACAQRKHDTLNTNELGVVLGFGGRPYGYLFPVRGHSGPFTPKALDVTYQH